MSLHLPFIPFHSLIFPPVCVCSFILSLFQIPLGFQTAIASSFTSGFPPPQASSFPGCPCLSLPIPVTVLTSFRSFSYSALPAFSATQPIAHRPPAAGKPVRHRVAALHSYFPYLYPPTPQRKHCFRASWPARSSPRHFEPCRVPPPDPRLRHGHFTYKVTPDSPPNLPGHAIILASPRPALSCPVEEPDRPRLATQSTSRCSRPR